MQISSYTLVGLLTVLLVFASAVYLLRDSRVFDDAEPLACTEEARLCPDGGYVSRTRPNCHFSACPDNGVPSQTDARTVLIETTIGEGARGLDVYVTPIELMEDSRCPVDVTCIWAGRVVVRVQLESGLGTAVERFEVGTEITTEAEIVELVEVRPTPRSGTALSPDDYTFIFRITKRTDNVL